MKISLWFPFFFLLCPVFFTMTMEVYWVIQSPATCQPRIRQHTATLQLIRVLAKKVRKLLLLAIVGATVSKQVAQDTTSTLQLPVTQSLAPTSRGFCCERLWLDAGSPFKNAVGGTQLANDWRKAVGRRRREEEKKEGKKERKSILLSRATRSSSARTGMQRQQAAFIRASNRVETAGSFPSLPQPVDPKVYSTHKSFNFVETTPSVTLFC